MLNELYAEEFIEDFVNDKANKDIWNAQRDYAQNFLIFDELVAVYIKNYGLSKESVRHVLEPYTKKMLTNLNHVSENSFMKNELPMP